MASQLQIEANRRNAQLSSGPKTPEGKAAVRLNALRHGLTAQHAVVQDEEAAEFLELQQSFEEHYQPRTPDENVLVQQVVAAAWRLSRVRGLETGLFNRLLEEEKSDMKRLKISTRHDRHAHVFLRDARGDNTLTTLARYETRIERAFYRALDRLVRLQAGRRTQPDQTNPISTPPQPQPTESKEPPILASPCPQVSPPPPLPVSLSPCPPVVPPSVPDGFAPPSAILGH